MKVLFTGMASSHVAPNPNVTFFNLLAEHMSGLATVDWQTPSVTWTKEFLESYDAMFLGVVPPTGPTANKVYGAMHAINLMFDSPKLHLVVDHPQLWQYKTGFAAISRSVDSIFSTFYSSRSEFKIARDPRYADSIYKAAQKLLTREWPKTIYPGLPWKDDESVSRFLSQSGDTKYVPLNFDASLLADLENSNPRVDMWVLDSSNTAWARQISNLVSYEIVPMKNSLRSTDAEVSSKISMSIGSLISPQDRGVGTWWSYRYIQSLNANTPVFSDWRETGKLSSEWNTLASTLEDMSDSERLELAISQKEQYAFAIPSKIETIEVLDAILNDSKKESYSNARS